MTHSDDPNTKGPLKSKKLREASAEDSQKTDDDHTVIAHNMVSPESESSTAGKIDHENSDATQFKPPSQRNEAADATQFKPSHQHSKKQDVTRFNPPNPNLQQTENRDEVPRARIKSSAATDEKSAISAPGEGDTRVLKERFLLEKVLGVGGMGIVYKAKDRLKVEAQDREPYVAIKVLGEEFKTHPEAFIALQRESRKAQRIAHPNTVKVYDFDRDGDTVFMTMEYMEGKPLDQLIKQYQATGLPREDVWKILSGICSALAVAHSENIVHSDFKPGNVFVTTDGMAKIFDFGIARAVANVDRHSGKEQDQTVFDAGELGALTPAYASLEMLQGETPDVRDDIYALGCVAYELFTGEHPFNRLPADEAFHKNLKPKRINSINKRQWKAIEAALSFKREDRIESADTFYKQLTLKKKPQFILITSLLLMVAGAAYYANIEPPVIQPPKISETEIRNELEFNIRYNLYTENIEKLIAKPSFTSEWEENLWSELQGVLAILSGETNEWYLSTRNGIYQLYLDKIKTLRDASNYLHADILITNAYRYTDDETFLDNEQSLLAETINKAQLNKERREQERKRLAKEKRVEKASQSAEKTKNTGLFNVALSNVDNQLKCTSKLNMRDFNIAIEKLRSLDINRYESIEDSLSTQLAQCITTIGKHYPEHAQDAKRYALHIFKNNPALMAVTIKERDACNQSIAGMGARGTRAVCRDKLQGGGVGPTLVVIPAGSGVQPFAIAKYETSVAELNEFCKVSSKCKPETRVSTNLPTTNVDISTISAYVEWLSQRTKKRYRLPTKKEWVYAAKSKNYTLNPNRNCQLSSWGIEKGGSLVNAATGKQNSWGLVNAVGNVRELALAADRKFVALGGSHQSTMDSCTALTESKHSGDADMYTGFRIVREINKES